MKLLISGSRKIKEYDLSPHIPENVDLIITGGAYGIDSIAEKYADNHKISKLILYPRYEKYGKSAPLKRNEIMVDLADKVLVIWDGVSKGSKYTINYAKKKNKNITIIIVKSKTGVFPLLFLIL